MMRTDLNMVENLLAKGNKVWAGGEGEGWLASFRNGTHTVDVVVVLVATRTATRA